MSWRRWSVVVVLGAAIGFALAGSATAIVNTYRISNLERAADARLCARENLTRAEIHVAYQNPAAGPRRDIPAEVRAVEPLLLDLLELTERNRKTSLARVRRLLPILDCSPNLDGKAARPYPTAKQRNFVAQYKAGKLDPTPEAQDVDSGPDE